MTENSNIHFTSDTLTDPQVDTENLWPELEIEDYEQIPDESAYALEEKHVGHNGVLGNDTVFNDLYTTEDMIQSDKLRISPSERPSYWEDVVSHTGQELAEKAYSDDVKARENVNARAARKTRERLKDLFLQDSNVKIMNKYMSAPTTDLPPIFQHWFSESGSKNWAEWVSKYASNDQLMNFLQWHNFHMVEQKNKPEVQQQITEHKQRYIIAVDSAILLGTLPEKANHAIKKVDSLRVDIGDVFDTLMREAGGYHIYGSNRVVIDVDHIDWAAMHEFNHAVLGSLPFRWLNEALTEHIAKSMEKGNYGEVDAYGRKWGAYQEERDLFENIARMISLVSKSYATTPSVVRGFITAYADAGNRDVILNGFNEDLKTFFMINDNLVIQGSAFEAIENKIQHYTQELAKSGITGTAATNEAVRKVRSDLLQRPRVVFDSTLYAAA